MEDLTGKQLGAYQIIAPFGEGGMATVYKAFQPSMDRYVALKILPRHFASDPQFVGRFKQEAKIIAKLQHPHILPVFDFGEADGYTYLVMPFIETGTLTDLLQNERLSLQEIRRIIIQIGEALDYAHSHGLIHRDIKPSNILIDERGNCLLTDFGIAKIVEGTSHFTKTGTTIGTPDYMSPEQGRGDKLIDARSDIYSLGIILYEMVVGRVPFKAETPIAVVFKHIQDPLPLPRLSNPDLPEEVELVILKSVAKQAEDRFASASEMIQGLQAAIPERIETYEKKHIEDPVGIFENDLIGSQATFDQLSKHEQQDKTKPKKMKKILVWGIVIVVGIIGIVSLLSGSFFDRNQNSIPEPTLPPRPTSTPQEETLPVESTIEEKFKVCQVTDVGGIDDKSFNATAWKGVQDAVADFDIEAKFLESQQQTDYERNINAFIEEECDLIITVGFLLGDATAAAAEANPDQKLAIIDFAYDPGYDNVVGLVFGIDQAAFLTGYVAASATQTGKVATFGGLNIPPVTAFMDGYWYGVAYYNQAHGTSVEVLGWDPAAQDGLFTGNFESADDGRAMGESLMDEGVDVILPVAGPVGLGTAAAIQERGGGWIVGVDTDWTISASEYSDIVLTSVLKNMDVAVYAQIEAALNDSFGGGLWIGTLENGGVGLAGLDNMDSGLQDELNGIIDGIIAGGIQTAP